MLRETNWKMVTGILYTREVPRMFRFKEKIRGL